MNPNPEHLTKLSARMNKWIQYSATRSKPKVRLFCFPYAGGNAAVFSQWKFMMPEGIETHPIQYPGRGNRIAEPLCLSMREMISELAEVLQSFVREPYAFFGYSMGAVVAFETARLLRRQYGSQPEQLILAAKGAPGCKENGPTRHLMDDDAFLESLRTLGGVPAEFFEHPELIEFMLPILRADFQLIESYDYDSEEPLDCPITIMGGEQDAESPLESLVEWQSQTSGPFRQLSYPGDHFFLNDCVAEIVSDVSSLLIGDQMMV